MIPSGTHRPDSKDLQKKCYFLRIFITFILYCNVFEVTFFYCHLQCHVESSTYVIWV
jgi:hypothetical protein